MPVKIFVTPANLLLCAMLAAKKWSEHKKSKTFNILFKMKKQRKNHFPEKNSKIKTTR